MRKIKKNELAQCPFCGGTAVVYSAVDCYYAQCNHCKSSGAPSDYHATATAQWNMRRVESYLNMQIEDMKKALNSIGNNE